jgi:hypothetical protein
VRSASCLRAGSTWLSRFSVRGGASSRALRVGDVGGPGCRRTTCQDRTMLRSADVTCTLALPASPFHNLHWVPSVEFTLDCFVCERTGQTTNSRVVRSEPSAPETPIQGCTTPPRGLLRSTTRSRRTARLFVPSSTSAGRPSRMRSAISALRSPLTANAWVRLTVGYYCPHQSQSGKFTTQTNLVRPTTSTCDVCSTELAHSEEAPRVRLLS